MVAHLSYYLSSNTMVIISIIIVVVAVNFQPSSGAEYTARYQPEFNNVKFDTYLKNPRLFNLQLQCLLFDGPCDVVGRFLKPRIAKALLGECYLCTPNQEKEIQKLLIYVQEKRPDLYKAAVSKYLQNQGIQVSQDEPTNNSGQQQTEDKDKQGL